MDAKGIIARRSRDYAVGGRAVGHVMRHLDNLGDLVNDIAYIQGCGNCLHSDKAGTRLVPHAQNVREFSKIKGAF